MFNEYSFVPRSAILNGLGSLRILPYRPPPLVARGRLKGGGEEDERERESKRKTIDVARCIVIATIGKHRRTGVACLALILFRLFFHDNISSRAGSESIGWPTG